MYVYTPVSPVSPMEEFHGPNTMPSKASLCFPTNRPPSAPLSVSPPIFHPPQNHSLECQCQTNRSTCLRNTQWHFQKQSFRARQSVVQPCQPTQHSGMHLCVHVCTAAASSEISKQGTRVFNVALVFFFAHQPLATVAPCFGPFQRAVVGRGGVARGGPFGVVPAPLPSSLAWSRCVCCTKPLIGAV